MGLSRASRAMAWMLCISAGTNFLAGCSSAPKKPNPETEKQIAELRNQITSLDGRIEKLQSELAAAKAPQPKAEVPELPTVAAIPPAADQAGVHPEPPMAPSDPDAGFVNDAAIASFRQGMILFDTQKYPEAVLAFSAFLDRYADHPLAGAAQYYVGESYFQQKENHLAYQELNRVLDKYPHSSKVPATLERLIELTETLQLSKENAHDRELLSALFPASPAAGKLNARKAEAPAAEPAVEGAEPSAAEAPAANAASPTPEGGVDAPPATASPGLDSPPPTAPMGESEAQ